MHVVWYIMICMIVWLYIYSWKKVGTGGRQFKFLFLDLRYLNVSMSNIAQARVRDPNHPANQIVPAASERRVAGSVPCVVFVADIVLPGMTIQTKYIIHVYIYTYACIHVCVYTSMYTTCAFFRGHQPNKSLEHRCVCRSQNQKDVRTVAALPLRCLKGYPP
jgi:hypothetical protein